MKHLRATDAGIMATLAQITDPTATTNAMLSHQNRLQPRRHKTESNHTMTAPTIESRVRTVICDILEVHPDKVTDTAHFYDDLHADSLDSVEIAMAFEDEFDCEIGDSDIEAMKTVRDAIDIITRLI